MSEKNGVEIYVSGRVQGVGYRFFTEEMAERFGITGYSMNLPDGRVYLEIEGERDSLERLIKELWKGPPLARVREVKIRWKEYNRRFKDFLIRY